jgi:geranylgeranyl pyrophosphate synthase
VGGPVDEELGHWLEEARAWSEEHLEGLTAEMLEPGEAGSLAWPAALAEACRYALFGGGKRLRPALVRLFCTSFGGSLEDAARPAAAIEMIHTYSLVHDDLPCMDDDDLRRGRPTCHKVYGEAMGVLVGDALLTQAFAVLAGAPSGAARMAGVLARAAGGAGMVGGQVLDMSVAGSGAQAADVRAVHLAKTAALIAAACELGALAGGASEQRCELSRTYGTALGLGFQAVDDILDVTGDAATLGKTPGKDQELDRATTVTVMGLEAARAQASALAEEAHAAARSLGFDEQSLPARLVDTLLQRSS